MDQKESHGNDGTSAPRIKTEPGVPLATTVKTEPVSVKEEPSPTTSLADDSRVKKLLQEYGRRPHQMPKRGRVVRFSAASRRLRCPRQGCTFMAARQDTIDRHCTYHHDGAKKPLNCKLRWCRKQFWSRRGLFNHLDKVHAKKPRDRNNNVAVTAREATKRALRVKKEKIEREVKQERQEIKKEPSTSTLVRGPHAHKLAHDHNHNCRFKLRQDLQPTRAKEAEVEVIDLTEDQEPPSASPSASPPKLLLDPLAGVGSRVVSPGESPTSVYTYHPDAALAARLSTPTNAIPSPLSKWGPATLVKLGPAKAKGATTSDDEDDDIQIVHEDIKNMKTEK